MMTHIWTTLARKHNEATALSFALVQTQQKIATLSWNMNVTGELIKKDFFDASDFTSDYRYF